MAPTTLLYIQTENGDIDDHIYRSGNQGQTWLQITDHAEGEVWGGENFLAGDRNVPGRVSGAANGQGVFYGDTDKVSTPCFGVTIIRN